MAASDYDGQKKQPAGMPRPESAPILAETMQSEALLANKCGSILDCIAVGEHTLRVPNL
jgi:hypothetical protein